MSLVRAALIASAVATLFSCSKQGKTATARDLSQFECNERRVEYFVAGGFGAEEAGVTMVCDNQNPRIEKWRVDDGERSESTHELSSHQFNEVWIRIDSTGWRHLSEECKNPGAESDDPAYVIDVGDHAKNISINCQGKTLPFPYDRIVNELDLRAAGFGEQESAL
tara:strand:+ start:45872 stop:46369 length:498 start_codon:yes stop_codon:yes gene_type:complete